MRYRVSLIWINCLLKLNESFSGISGLETITFLNSRLEEMPRLDFLFNNLTNLKAVYVDGSSMPDACFGIYPSLPSLELFSFKGK